MTKSHDYTKYDWKNWDLLSILPIVNNTSGSFEVEELMYGSEYGEKIPNMPKITHFFTHAKRVKIAYNVKNHWMSNFFFLFLILKMYILERWKPNTEENDVTFLWMILFHIILNVR